ncbi:PREDICTED: protein FAR1-RELATED SEQUENCE 5-like [Erythranthe guttata]|nr:PREDICTED: protein FAR1-RELATED SEQUENCE 5-like [Erythranthe guttata]|eukprot:XP_012829668.1 PREDICTED: protein FAR1-RELATED SEQUENCE 5-like [Erythranthe guttata]
MGGASPNDANSIGSGSGGDATSFFSLHTYLPDGDIDLEPYEGMEFESEESAKAFYNSYARRVGFSTRVSSSRRSRKDGAIIQRSFVCAKEGFRNLNEKRTKDREIKRPRTVTRVGCKASLSVKIQDSGKWVVSGFVREHNHELVPPDQVHCLRSHRQISGPAKTLIDTLQAAGMGPRRIMSVLVKEYGGISKVGFTEVDCRNYMRNNRQRNMEGDIQLLLDYLKQKQSENPSFFYAIQGDEDQYTGNVFWADPKSRSDYNHFGDTVTFDTTYRSNRYRLPFVPFTGLNHHGQPVLFGCAFLINESEASFVWLFKTWLSAMFGRSPLSITTEHDSVIRSAIMQVLPNTRHRFCKWHMFKQCQEKLSHVYFDTMNTSPVLKTPSPMEKQASEFYTRKLFTRFQEELVSTLTFTASKVDDNGEVTTYRVAKFGEEHKFYHVNFNVLEMKASCSCRMFEFSGLLCRHVLAVFRVTNVLTLPSYYISKRWTRNAKSSVVLEERAIDPFNGYLESHTVRYNTLRHEAFKFVDEGAESVESYNVAMAVLMEASNKVAFAVKNEGKASVNNGPMRNKSSYCRSEGEGSSTQQLSEVCYFSNLYFVKLRAFSTS